MYMQYPQTVVPNYDITVNINIVIYSERVNKLQVYYKHEVPGSIYIPYALQRIGYPSDTHFIKRTSLK